MIRVPHNADAYGLQSDFINLVHTWRDLARGYQGSSMAIYTEVSDTESEMNGIMTYDRKVAPIAVTLLFHHVP